MLKLKLSKTEITTIEYLEPTRYFAKFYRSEQAALLTGKGEADISRYSFIGIHPHTIITFAKQYQIRTQQETTRQSADFWDFQKQILAATEYHLAAYPANLCGGIGYYAYDALHQIEEIEFAENNYQMPLYQIAFYNRYLIFDHWQKQAWQIDFSYQQPSLLAAIEEYEPDFSVSNITPESTAEEYKQKVQQIRQYILAGDVYEVNLSQQIRAEFQGNPYLLFQKLYDINAAPFSGYLNFGKHKIICNSPEMFLQAAGRQVQTRPIKGTVSRSSDPEIDAANKQWLLDSTKDQAELFMIIDLLRNDLGKICQYGSVQVQAAKRLEAYENVYHLIGIISGQMESRYDYIDLMRATFPGGSITGCPKIRSMEIIQELESYNRHLYTGTIFMINQNYLSSNIVIRSAIITEDKIFFNSGGAITIDSSAEEEYAETEAKLSSLLQAIKNL
ncbi:MAG: anthranilate synthase component I family protein [Candidatus Cloacimonadales bacterium]